MDWITTSTILRDLRDYRNETAWAGFVGRFRDPLLRFTASQGIPEAQAPDVVQETLTGFAESLRRGRYDRDKGRLSTWLFAIAFKQILKERARGARRDRPIGGGAEIEKAMSSGPSEQAARDDWQVHWDRFVAHQCLEQIRREFRSDAVRAFELVVRDDRAAQEAADEVGIPLKAVYNAKHRILKRMRELRAELETTA